MQAPRDDSPLKDLRVASPCHADWDEMDGDERVRFCRLCRLNVYNLSEMSSADAEALIREKEGRLCVRFYRRGDGTVLTRNCPVGLRAIKRRLAVIGGGLAACLGWMFAGAASANSGSRGVSNGARSAPAAWSFSPLRSFVSYLESMWNRATRPPVVQGGIRPMPPGGPAPFTGPAAPMPFVGPPVPASTPVPAPNPASPQTGSAVEESSAPERLLVMGKVAVDPQPMPAEMGERSVAPAAPPTVQEDF